MAVAPQEAEALKALLAREPGLEHLYVKKHGHSLKICAGDPPWPLARITALDRNLWGLSLPLHNGRWERTPFVGTMEELVHTLTIDLRVYLDVST